MQERDDHIDRIEKEISEWEAKVETLKLKANLGKMEARDGFHALEHSVTEHLRPIRTKLKVLKSETSEAWRDLFMGVEASWGETKDALKRAFSRFKH